MDTINGIPAHPLFVHFVVVAVPVTALMAIVAVVWPRARAHLGIAPMILALLTLIAVPITTSAGESLESSMGASSPAIEHHAELGDKLILVVGPLFGLVALWWLLFSPWVLSRVSLGEGALRISRIVVGALTVVVAVLAIVMVVLVGHSGSDAVWGR